jgi:hypothetical protein
LPFLITSVAAATPSPTPFPDYTGDPNLITPGVWGFIAILGVAVATVLLILDMTRRIRRSRYREEVRIKLEEEQAAADAAAAAAARKASRGKPKAAPSPTVKPTADPDAAPRWGG